MISRRKFIALGSLAAATLGAEPMASLKQDSAPRAAEPPVLTRSTFAPLVGSVFTLRASALDRLDLELVDVLDHATAGRAPARHEGQFTLVLRGPADSPFEQDTYIIEHERLGSFALFLVPAGPTEQGRVYHAVFNNAGAPTA